MKTFHIIKLSLKSPYLWTLFHPQPLMGPNLVIHKRNYLNEIKCLNMDSLINCTSFLQILRIIYLLIPNNTHKHEFVTLKEAKTCLITNHLNQSIYLANQEHVLRLCCGFSSPQHIKQKCWATTILQKTCWAIF